MNKRYLLYNNTIWEPYKTFEYTGDFESFTLGPDTYLIVANGACGGYNQNNDFISWGGTTYGILDLDHQQQFFAAVGGNAEDGGWNGGSGGKYSGGGGASDIRLSNAPDSSHEEYITVPDDYLELTFIRSNGSQYIDLGYKPTPNTKIECVAAVANNGGYGALLGSRTTWVRDSTIIFTNFGGQDKLCWGCGNQEILDTKSFGYGSGYTKHRFVIDGTNLSWYTMSGGLEGSITGTSRPANNYTLYLFDLNHAGNPDGSKVTAYVYYVKIWENDELVRWYVPYCKSADTTDSGMYEIMQGSFCPRLGSTTNFILGQTVTNKTQGGVRTVIDRPSLMSRFIVAGGGGCTTEPSGSSDIEFDYTSFGGGPISGHKQTNLRASAPASQNDGFAFGDGEAGGGGGWYGGYANGGGSSYVLTASSYKPEGYMAGYEDVYQSLYLRNTLMLPYQAFEGPSITIYKAMTRYPITDDIIIVPYTGEQQSMTLVPSKYRIKCYGADGAVGREIKNTAKGGYVEGIVKLPEEIPLWYNVGFSNYLNGMYSYGEINRYFTNADVNAIFDNKAWYCARGYDVNYNGVTGWASSATPASSRYRWVRNASGGGFVDVRLIERPDPKQSSTRPSDLSRIIVAGGAGGQGSPEGYGGDGGGEIGNSPYGVVADKWHGTNDGGGNQDGEGFSIYSFGATGAAGEYNSYDYPGYGGCGGGGWYAGDGTHGVSGVSGINEVDQNQGGAGGSSYVLTASSYKPEDYLPDERYWMTDTKNITGGNPVRGMTRIEVEPMAIPVLVIAKDETSYKAYDESNDSWYNITVDNLAPLTFDTYGVNIESIKSDTGLTFPYRIYMYDQIGFDIDRIYTHVIPNEQTVGFKQPVEQSYKVMKTLCDCDKDNKVDIRIDTDFEYIENDRYVDIDLKVTPSTELPEVDPIVYTAEVKLIREDGKFCPEPVTPIYGSQMALCNTRNVSDTPSGYKEYVGEYMPDGTTPVTSVTNSVSCTVDRDIYIAALLNDSIIRVVRYNITDNKSYLIRDNIAKSYLSTGGATSGSLLYRDGILYLTNSFMVNTANIVMAVIPIDPEKEVTRHMSSDLADDPDYKENAFGQAYWYDDTKILFRTKGGHMIFNIVEKYWTFYEAPQEQSDVAINSFAVGKNSMMEFKYDITTVEPYLFNRNYEPIENPPEYNLAQGYKWVIYVENEEKFYVATLGHLYIFADDVGAPRLLQDITIPTTTYRPKTLTYAKGFVYVTFELWNEMYAYDTIHGDWIHSTLPFTVRATDNTTWNKPTAFRDFFFVGADKLYVTNANVQEKHRMGHELASIFLRTNSNYDGQITYNQSFITIDDIGVHYHTGNIVKMLARVPGTSDGIYMSEQYLGSDYLKLLGHKFTERENATW